VALFEAAEMRVLLCLLLALGCLLGSNVLVARVALAVQGKEEELNKWVTAWNLMSSLESDSTNLDDHAILFLQSYDKPLKKCPATSICHFAPKTTWASGRNLQGKAIYHYEAAKHSEFRYWLFADSDMLNMTCSAHGKDTRLMQAAGCITRFAHFLQARTSYAQVFYYKKLTDELEVQLLDCGDQRFHAIHRAAVPILLPYVEALDPLSWQEAQVILWRVASYCLPNAGIASGMLNLARKIDTGNRKYPYGQKGQERSELITKLFHQRLLLKVNASAADARKGACTPGNGEIFRVGMLQETSSAAWRSSMKDHRQGSTVSNYQHCLKMLKPRFQTYMSMTNNNISAAQLDEINMAIKTDPNLIW